MLNQFLSFDKLIGTKLITILYYLGLIGIGLGLIAGVLSGLGTMVSINFLGGIGMIIGSIIGAALGLLFWRFMCELYMLLFRMADDLRDIKVAKAVPPSVPPVI